MTTANFKRRRLLLAALTLAMASLPPAAMAEPAYPTKPIKIVVGYPPGGSVDQIARFLTEAWGRHLGGVMVIENLGGAAGTIGAQRVARSTPDGYTLLVASCNELVAAKAVDPNVRYDVRKDFTPIGVIAHQPAVIAVGPQSGIKSIGDLVAAARKRPGKLAYGSSGVGSSLHFAGELLNQKASIKIEHVPYRGVSPLTTDLIGGNIDIAVLSLTAALPFARSGRIVPLAVTGTARTPLLPNVPAMNEVPALHDYDLTSWFAVMAPPGLPDGLRAKLADSLKQVLQEPELRKNLAAAGAEPSNGREDLAKLLVTDSEKYTNLAKVSRMRN